MLLLGGEQRHQLALQLGRAHHLMERTLHIFFTKPLNDLTMALRSWLGASRQWTRATGSQQPGVGAWLPPATPLTLGLPCQMHFTVALAPSLV